MSFPVQTADSAPTSTLLAAESTGGWKPVVAATHEIAQADCLPIVAVSLPVAFALVSVVFDVPVLIAVAISCACACHHRYKQTLVSSALCLLWRARR